MLSSYSFSILGRSDIDISEYEDFALNNSKFEIGRKNVIVYKKDGTRSGVIEKAIPNFDSLTDNTHWTLWDDSQIFTGADHVNDVSSLSFTKRHLRKDVELFEASKDDNILSKFSEDSKLAIKFKIGSDYSFGRGEKVAFEAKHNKVFDGKDVVRGNLVARAGAGTNKLAREEGGSIAGTDYGKFTGGLNHISGTENLNNHDRAFLVTLQKKQLTPLDAEALRGDSGSPIFYYDTSDDTWKIVASNSGGSLDPYDAYGKYSVYRSAKTMIDEYKKQISTEIDNDTVEINNGGLIVGGKKTVFDKYKGNLIKSGTINAISNHTYSEELISDKNQVFNANNTQITVNGNLDTKIARFEFKHNATIKGNGNLQTAGYIVENGATLTMENNINEGIIVRKIGEGTLKISGTGNNEGKLFLGDGKTILSQTGGYAASDIKLAQQAEVFLDKDGQIKENNIYFGLRGGIVDLNGHNLNFNDIYHIDKGATFKNTNENEKSKFTFNPTGNRVFLGSFKDNMDIDYISDSNWQLRGDTDIKGDININNGSITVVGDNLVTTNKNYVENDQFKEVKIKAANINVNNNKTLNVKRASKIDANINAKANSNILLEAKGKIPEKINYVGQDYSEINKIELKGGLSLEAGSNLKMDLEKEHNIEINSKIKGNGNILKVGEGTAKITSVENTENNSKISIEGGKLYVENENSLGNSHTTISNNSVLAINGNANLANILNRVDRSSKGTISFNENIESIPTEYKNYSNLFIGSFSDIVIGTEGSKIDSSLTKLNLGGDTGTITLKGLKDDNTSRNIVVGDGVHNSTIIIDGISEENKNLNITTNKKANLIFKNVQENAEIPIISLNYGTYTDKNNSNLLKENASGVLVYESNEESVSVKKDYAIGAKKDTTVNIGSIVTNKDLYKFSGEGTLNINATGFENKEINVDAQYQNGGVVNISSDNKLLNDIKVIGNKDGKNDGSITLNLAKDSINGNNNVVVKDGGIIDLNSNNLDKSLSDDSNEFGVVKNTSSDTSTLNISKDTVIKPKILGNINILNNSHTLELTNEANEFSENTSISLNNATLNNYSNSINENVSISLDNSRINTKKSIKSSITSKNESTIERENKENINVNKIVVEDGNLTLSTKSELNEGANKSKSVKDVRSNYKSIVLNDNSNLKIEDQYFNIENLEANKTNELTLKNSRTFIVGNGSNILSSNVNKINLENSALVLRDHHNENDNAPIEVVGTNSRIIVGVEGYSDDGGGSGVTFKNPINIDKGNILNIGTGQFWNNSSGIKLQSNISGSGKLILSREEYAKFDINSNFKDFTGEVYLEKGGYSRNMVFDINAAEEEDRTLNYKLSGNLNADKIGNKDLIIKDMSKYEATFNVKDGGLTLDGTSAYNTHAKIINEGNSELILRSNKNQSDDDRKIEDINARNIGNGVIRKEGAGNLIITDAAVFDNYNKVYVDKGKLTLKKEILDNKQYAVSKDSSLELNFIRDDYKLKSEVLGEGNLILNPKHEIVFEVSKLNNTGNLEILNDVKIDLDEEKVLTQNLKGGARLSLNDTNSLTLGGNIEKFTGTFNLNNSNLKLKSESTFNASLEGSGLLENTSNNLLSLNDTSNYTGAIKTTVGKIEVKNDSKILKYILENEDVIISNDNEFDLTSKSFENNNNHKLILKDNSKKYTLNKENLEDIKNLEVDKANLEILESEGVIDIKSLALKNSSVTLTDPKLSIENYENNNSTFTINLSKVSNNIFNVKNIKGEINVILNLSKTVSDYLNKGKIKLINSNVNLNILNFDKLYNDSKNYKYVFKKSESGVELFKILRSLGINILYLLDDINENSVDVLNNSYENHIKKQYIFETKKDTEFKAYDNTIYKNELISHGFNLEFEKVFDIDKFKLSTILSYTNTSNSIKTNVEDEKDITQKYNINRVHFGIGTKYKNISINTKLGVSTVAFDDKNRTKLTYLNNESNINFSIKNKNISINKYIGYKYNKLINETLTKNYDNVSEIIYKNPLSIYYGNSYEFNYKKFNFNLSDTVMINFNDTFIKNKDELIKSKFNSRISNKFNFRLAYLLTNNLSVFTEYENYIRANDDANNKIKLGINIKY
ncbi:S6 family peptidase [Oceanivirga miroungae]|uniref:Pic serine protease, autotransporter n=1 Tax=Oceanivirga miroungae TaxID=1130046 RepID=A0A6I8MC10_9FUSO|nr:S6 family peptidase [Oceanivirga miroungae]VWL85753.1 Pic serine protease precursor, autotransporter [Oceanivirga miroungae]